MATTKKKEPTRTTGPALRETAEARAYETALKDYESAIGMLRNGDFSAAREALLQVKANNPTEQELCERCGTYALICQRKLETGEPEPTTTLERYRKAVALTNLGQCDEAIRLLSQALKDDPTCANCLFVRASAWALKGAAEKAVEDLRQAIVVDPSIRFQAANDPDFESIREEPSFIDIIEPTPSGA